MSKSVNSRNVVGALNANLAFFKGLGAGGGFEMSEEEMLATVWGREAEIREDTTGWTFGYLTFAYEALTLEELRAYVDLSGTAEGRALNAALFAAFEAVFDDTSFSLGQAVSRFMVGDEL